MRGYLSYFKTQLLTGLQYKEAALAGLTTQFFWGFLNCMVYQAFYSHASISDINLQELTCYVWLNQAFFSLIYIRVKDNEIMDAIKNGTVAYELCRPYDIYTWWYIKFLAKKYAAVFLRFIPVIVIAFILPEPYRLSLPSSFLHFILFFITLLLGSFIITAIIMIIQSIGFFSNQDSGVMSIFCTIVELLSGYALPLPLLPKIINYIGKYLPFRLIGDLPFRVYSGNLSINYALNSMFMQIIWIIILLIIGKLIMKKALSNVTVQGG
jgi:ABC-2 type transport system permease protein